MNPTTRNIVLAVASGLVVLGVAAWGWEVPSDLSLILKAGAAVALLGSFTVSTLGFLRGANTERWRAGAPLLINAFVLMLWIAGPLEALTIRINLWSNYEKRMQVVELARAGRLKERVALRDTSNFGEQLDASGKSLKFKMTAGCMGDCWSGFVYVFGDAPPEAEALESTVTLRKLQDHWFWVDVIQ